MTRWGIAAAALALSLLTYFQFPGHTWLQQDSQIYAPVLENQYDHAILRNDILVQQSHVEFTIYDDVALLLRRIPLLDLSYRQILAGQQILARAIGIWGLFLIAQAMGLSAAAAATAAMIASLGASIAGPAVLTTEYEPTPRAVALPLVYAAIGLAAHRRFRPAVILAALATLYQFPAAAPFWIVFAGMLLQRAMVAPLAILTQITPSIERLQRMRTAYVWISTWPLATIVQHVLTGGIAGAAYYRVRGKMRPELRAMLPGLVVIGLASMPLSWLLLEYGKLAIAPQLQPLRWLLWVTFAMQLLAAAAAAHAARWWESALWFAIAYLPALQPLSWRRFAVVALLGVATALARRFRPAFALAAFLVIPTLGGVVNYPQLHNAELAELSRWARLSTDRDSVFLFADAGRSLEPGIFRSEALRAVYVDWKGGGQVNYLPEFAEQWWSRWQQTAGKLFQPDDVPKYSALGIRYVILQPQHRLARAPEFENGKWVVYRVAD